MLDFRKSLGFIGFVIGPIVDSESFRISVAISFGIDTEKSWF
jgi:hypothetical protein